MNIWDERYYNQELDMLESQQTFQLFQHFLKMPLPRNLIKFTQETYFPNNESTDEFLQSTDFKTKYNRILTHSKRYKWFMRASEYDKYQRDLHFQKKLEKVHEWELPELEDAMTVTNIHKDMLKKIHNADDDDFPLTKKAYAERATQESYSQSVDNVYNIVFGGVKQNKSENTTDKNINLDDTVLEINQKVTHKKSLKEEEQEIREYLKELNMEMKN